MKKILISINPEYVEKILSGDKKYEYRTKVAKERISSIIIYSTAPTQKIVAEVEIKGIISGNPKWLWDETREFSGITKEFFLGYFQGRAMGYAYQLGKVTKYDSPFDLESFGMKNAPQSFVYV